MKPQELASSAIIPYCMNMHSRGASTLPVFTPGHLKINISVVFLLKSRSTLALVLSNVSAGRAFAFMNDVIFDDGILDAAKACRCLADDIWCSHSVDANRRCILSGFGEILLVHLQCLHIIERPSFDFHLMLLLSNNTTPSQLSRLCFLALLVELVNE
jgi:hypothetical protein